MIRTCFSLAPFPNALCVMRTYTLYHVFVFVYYMYYIMFAVCGMKPSLYLWTLLTGIHRHHCHRCCRSRHPCNVLPAWNAIFLSHIHSGNFLFMRLSFSLVIFCTYVQKEITSSCMCVHECYFCVFAVRMCLFVAFVLCLCVCVLFWIFLKPSN